MIFLFSLTVGVLYAASFYMILQRSIVKMVIGLILLSHASNLLIFCSGGLRKGSLPIISKNTGPSVATMPDPLPQALILTAIVISFGVLAFVLVLAYRTYTIIGTDDSDALKESEE